MVYSIGDRDPYATLTAVDVIDGDYGSTTKMKFLHPDQVDAVAKIEGRVQMEQGYPVDPATAPKKICWRSGNRGIPDFISCSSVMVVSEKVREIIEAFEPGVHQLLPVDVYRPKADTPFARYYWMVVCNLIDSVDDEHTTFKWFGDKSTGRGMWDGEGDQSRKLVFNQEQIGKRHLWRDQYMIRSALFISDNLLEAFTEAGVSGLESHHYEQV